MLNELLLNLTGPEIALWHYLSELELQQGGQVITLPAETSKLYTRQHLKRILKSLQAKRYLAIITTPTNQHQVLQVAMATQVPRLNIFDVATRQECSGKSLSDPLEASGRTKMFRQPMEERSAPVGQSASCSRENVQAAPQLSLSLRQKDLKALIEKNQEQLMSEVLKLDTEELLSLRRALIDLAPWAKGKLSERAKLYAAIRFLQDGKSQAQCEVAWVNGVAKRADYQLRQVQRGVPFHMGVPEHIPAVSRRGAR